MFTVYAALCAFHDSVAALSSNGELGDFSFSINFPAECEEK
jgi:hypothetical protein